MTGNPLDPVRHDDLVDATQPPPGYSHPERAARDGKADPYGPIPGWICHRCATVVASAERHNQWHQLLDQVLP